MCCGGTHFTWPSFASVRRDPKIWTLSVFCTFLLTTIAPTYFYLEWSARPQWCHSDAKVGGGHFAPTFVCTYLVRRCSPWISSKLESGMFFPDLALTLRYLAASSTQPNLTKIAGHPFGVQYTGYICPLGMKNFPISICSSTSVLQISSIISWCSFYCI